MKSLLKDCKIVRAGNYASGTTDVKAPLLGVDTTGGGPVSFLVDLATIAAGAVTTVKLQHSDDTTDGNFADIAGTAQTVAADDDNGYKVLELLEPSKKYVRCYIDKDGANAVGASVTAILWNAGSAPAVQPSGVAGELHVAAVSGTA